MGEVAVDLEARGFLLVCCIITEVCVLYYNSYILSRFMRPEGPWPLPTQRRRFFIHDHILSQTNTDQS